MGVLVRLSVRLATMMVLTLCVFACAANGSRSAATVEFNTTKGLITVELYPNKAPTTVANFLRYVDAGRYDGASFYRVVRLDNQKPSDIPIQVIQGGLGLGAYDDEVETEAFPAIAHETTKASGLTHRDGALSMARLEPGTASSEFFIAIGDNSMLDFGGARNPDGQGYAVFGQVIDGMDVVREIQSQRSEATVAGELAVVRGQILSAPISIISLTRKR